SQPSNFCTDVQTRLRLGGRRSRATRRKTGLFMIGGREGMISGELEIAQFAGDALAYALLIGGSGDGELHSGAGRSILLGVPATTGCSAATAAISSSASWATTTCTAKDSDIVIGGRTAYDHRAAALWQILAEWASGDPYSVRVAKIQGGIGVPALNDSTYSTTSCATTCSGAAWIGFLSAPTTGFTP